MVSVSGVGGRSLKYSSCLPRLMTSRHKDNVRRTPSHPGTELHNWSFILVSNLLPFPRATVVSQNFSTPFQTPTLTKRGDYLTRLQGENKSWKYSWTQSTWWLPIKSALEFSCLMIYSGAVGRVHKISHGKVTRQNEVNIEALIRYL